MLESYIERKKFDAKVLAAHIVNMIGMAIGGTSKVSKGHINATAEQAIGQYLKD